jgi:glycosyltransferase 2 family protein
MEFLRRRLGLIFRALVSILLVAFLIRKIDWPKLWVILRTVNAEWLIVGAGCFLPVLLIVSWRWRMLLAVHGVRMNFGRIFELTMIGQFFSAFLLGTTGGDVIKIFYVARAVPAHRAAVSFTVVVDRVIGMVALLLFGVALSVTQLPLLLSTPGTKFYTGLFYLLALGGVVVSVLGCVGPIFLRSRRIRSLLDRVPFIHRGKSLIAAYEKSAHALGVNFLALIASIPSHMCITLVGYCVLRAMHLSAPLLPFCAIMAMVNMLIALPISVSGFGVREWLFGTFLGLFPQIDWNHAIAFSLAYFAVNLAWSLTGGPFYFLYRHETHTPPPKLDDVNQFSPSHETWNSYPK